MVEPKNPVDLLRPRLFTRDTCPDRGRYHYPFPDSILARADTILKLLPSHAQSQCPTCHLWVVWTPRAIDEGDPR